MLRLYFLGARESDECAGRYRASDRWASQRDVAVRPYFVPVTSLGKLCPGNNLHDNDITPARSRGNFSIR